VLDQKKWTELSSRNLKAQVMLSVSLIGMVVMAALLMMMTVAMDQAPLFGI